MRATQTFPISLPIDQVDMYRWVTEMTPEDYSSYAKAHLAMGSWFEGAKFFMVNVEAVGSDMVIQHYELLDHSRGRVKFYSTRSNGYILRWLPVTFGVPWEMVLRPVSARTCELTCTIGADFASAFLDVFVKVFGAERSLRRHLAEEGAAFARDIERKFASAPMAALR